MVLSNIDQSRSSKIFMGFLLTAPLKMHLNKAPKENLEQECYCLKEERFEDQFYWGAYLPEKKYTYASLQKVEEEMREKLSQLCPKLDCSQLQCVIFSQIFIG